MTDFYIQFGKHKNEKLSDVIVNDPQYIQWVMSNKLASEERSNMSYLQYQIKKIQEPKIETGNIFKKKPKKKKEDYISEESD